MMHCFSEAFKWTQLLLVLLFLQFYFVTNGAYGMFCVDDV